MWSPRITSPRPETAVKRAVDQALPGDARYFLWDSELKGFSIRVAPSGTKTYIVRYRPRGGGSLGPKRFVVVGRHGPLPPEKARMRAREILPPPTPREQDRPRNDRAQQPNSRSSPDCAEAWAVRDRGRRWRAASVRPQAAVAGDPAACGTRRRPHPRSPAHVRVDRSWREPQTAHRRQAAGTFSARVNGPVCPPRRRSPSPRNGPNRKPHFGGFGSVKP